MWATVKCVWFGAIIDKNARIGDNSIFANAEHDDGVIKIGTVIWNKEKLVR